MRKAVSTSITSLLLLYIAQTSAFASTSVDVKTEGGNASAKVSVKNSFNSTNTSSNTVDSYTKVRIETNGEVKEYESTNGDDVNIESSNGNAKVNISNNTGTKPSVTKVQEKINEATSEAQKKLDEAKKEKKNILELIESIILGLFKNLF